MGEQVYPVEVQSDHLEKITQAQPVAALAELIWNSLDADATKVEVFVEENRAPRHVGHRGCGTTAPGLSVRRPRSFSDSSAVPGRSSPGGSSTKRDRRFLHGQDGRGRFKAFALAAVATWDVTYLHEKELRSFRVTMRSSDIRNVTITDETPASKSATTGVTLTLSPLHKDSPVADVRRRPAAADGDLRAVPRGLLGRRPATQRETDRAGCRHRLQ